MISRIIKKLLFGPEQITPSNSKCQVLGAFNPGAVSYGNAIYLLVRVAESIKTDSTDYVYLPKWDCRNGYCYDRVPKTDVELIYRGSVVRFKHNGLVRLTHISHFRVAVIEEDGETIRILPEKPSITPQEKYEEYGIEDPRITRIGDRFYITYVAVSEHGIATALMSTTDFVSFERHGLIFHPENKDVVLFPEKINGNYFAIHRARGSAVFGKPELWLAHSPDLLHWGGHSSLMQVYSDWSCTTDEHGEPVCRMVPLMGRRSSDWDRLKVGAGVPPIKTEEGWLEIYHGVYSPSEEAPMGVYCAGAALFDLEDPSRLIARAPEPIISPTEDYETLKGGKKGYLANVVFPTGIIRQGDDLLIYCGAADTSTVLVKISLSEVLEAIKKGCNR
ncbi:MAG: glycoside hydrolase family 130 protein [bacterium]